ncbi:RlmE family RNA methyltransferase [Entomobacter blattae]|uniref:Ribosomal RNA large subunit methyltransferase E n=1 Tax=Entomobacter blattae TaxID=2762277 RepID=A0A7H1NSC6_9PROT|nr:RlmE family RNA methyltransferase [Entomobacter blattae]QNT78686.1 Ribosomal RNA large subunit methyltransferase E [Entomobacter blattae]
MKQKSGIPAQRLESVTVKKTRGKTTAQQKWLARQLNDPYVVAAKKQGWRSRASFKLIELNDRYGLIKKGMSVVDLGAAPGGWSQVALKEKAGKVVGIDLLEVEPVPGAEIIQGDFTDPEMVDRLKQMIDGFADIVLSDMAPNTTGHAATDHLRIMDLAEQALIFAAEILKEGGSFVAKVFQGGSEKRMLHMLKTGFSVVKHAKPPASRKESSELYVIATGFRPERMKPVLEEIQNSL